MDYSENPNPLYWRVIRAQTLKILKESAHISGEERANHFDAIGFNEFKKPRHFFSHDISACNR